MYSRSEMKKWTMMNLETLMEFVFRESSEAKDWKLSIHQHNALIMHKLRVNFDGSWQPVYLSDLKALCGQLALCGAIQCVSTMEGQRVNNYKARLHVGRRVRYCQLLYSPGLLLRGHWMHQFFRVSTSDHDPDQWVTTKNYIQDVPAYKC